MEKERKIAKVVRKVSFEEAEKADIEFWSNTDANFRLKELQRLRENYKRFIGIKAGAAIEKAINKSMSFT